MARMRQRLWHVIAAELTVATQLLVFLPPPAQAAAPVPQPAPSGETALARLRRPAPAPQEPVEINKTVPDVEPAPEFPSFSPTPTDEELTRARVFGEPLLPEEGDVDVAVNQALAQAITTYLTRGDSEDLSPMEGFIATYPSSRWRVAVQANVGSWYRKKKYFTRAQRHLNEAWLLGKHSTTDGVRRLAEFAAGELMVLHMQFGQVDPLEALVTELSGRELTGAITERLSIARATVWGLRNQHDEAIPSGSVALERIRRHQHSREEKRARDRNPSYRKTPFEHNETLHSFPATMEGASLAELMELADRTGMKLQMARRLSNTAEIPLPSVVHLNSGHFAALVERRGGRYRLDDPLLGGEVWMSRKAFEEETSGYFLVEQGKLPRGWKKPDRERVERVRGKCVWAFMDPNATRQCDRRSGGCTNSSCGSAGMAEYSFHLGRASLSISDNPVGYSPPLGPDVRFRVTYNQKEATQPTTFYYSNLGPRWTFDWLSYLEDDPTAVGEPVELTVRGGGREPYDDFVDGVSAPQQDARAVMTIASTSPIVYERELPDGSVEVYSETDGATTAPRKIFMTEWNDPQGNGLTFTYDSELRLVSVTDAIGQVTTLSYELASDPLKITKVTDPFGRFATLDYDEDGQLIRITDVIGLESELEYGATDFIRALTTPYGTTTFREGRGPYETKSNSFVEATDPLGGTERVEHIRGGSPLPSTDPANTVPTGFTGKTGLGTHLSIYYTKLAMDRATTDPPDPTTGNITRFRSSGTLTISGYQLQSTKLPLENRVWYEQSSEVFPNAVSPDGRPSKIGRVLDDGSSQIYRYEYNSRGKLTRITDPMWSETTNEYASNNQDLLSVKRKDGAEYVLLQEMTCNSTHQSITVKDAAGQTTTYRYTAEGQLETITTPERAGITETAPQRTITTRMGIWRLSPGRRQARPPDTRTTVTGGGIRSPIATATSLFTTTMPSIG